MEAQHLKEYLNYIWPQGSGLNPDEKYNLNLALLRLHELGDFEEIHFWGKISSLSKDYYIAQTLNLQNNYEFPLKRYFWCQTSTWTFAEIPEIQEQHKEHVNGFNSLLSGQPDLVLVEAKPSDEDEEVKEDAEEEQAERDSLASTEEEVVVLKNYTELDRLGFIVRSIDQDCFIVPQGGFRMTVDHELTRNLHFEGLTRDQLTDLKLYKHFRNVQTYEKRQKLDRDDAVFVFDFLDDVTTDKPQGCWSAQRDPTGNLAVIRSLLWPGYFAFHVANTRKFGSVYIGDGVKNVDLAFMI